MHNPIIELKNITKAFGQHIALQELNLAVNNGEFLTILGPSGCGKTTLLRLMGGFEQPDSGHIFIDGYDITNLPPEERLVNTVFQSYALFPHMTIFNNVAFGLKCNGIDKNEIKERVEETLKIVSLEKYSERKPNELSGGQKQRVAIARAIVNRPRVLLLDEPLSALDYKLRKKMQIELKQLQRRLGLTFIFITHDQEEALSMSDRVVIMNDGKILQSGTPRDIYEEPNSLFAAEFIGEANVFDAIVTESTKQNTTLKVQNKTITFPEPKQFKAGEKVHLIVRPEDLRVWTEKEVKNTDDMLPGQVEQVIYKGSTVDLIVRLIDGPLISATEFFDEDDEDLFYENGEKVWIHWLPGWEVILPYEG